MKLFIDDLRFPPDETWNDIFVDLCKIKCLAYAVCDYMYLIADDIRTKSATGGDSITHISFDHDLGDDDVATGYDILRWTIETYKLCGVTLPTITIHSANPVGVERMQWLLEEYYQSGK